MKPTTTVIAAAIAIALPLAACNRPDTDRTTSLPAGADRTAVVSNEPTGLSAPPAAADRTPFKFDPGAPGTQPSAELMAPVSGASVVDAKNDDRVAVRAQEAAAKAPDTASADAAKKQVMEDAQARMTGGARDTAANAPRNGALTPSEESTQMPKAGQVNNHSSTALEKDSGR